MRPALMGWRRAAPAGREYCRPVLSGRALGSVGITALPAQGRPVRVIAPPFRQLGQAAHPADHESNSIRVGVWTSHQRFVLHHSRLKRSRSEARSHEKDRASDSASSQAAETKAGTEADRRILHPETATGETRPAAPIEGPVRPWRVLCKKLSGDRARAAVETSSYLWRAQTSARGRHTRRPLRAPDRRPHDRPSHHSATRCRHGRDPDLDQDRGRQLVKTAPGHRDVMRTAQPRQDPGHGIPASTRSAAADRLKAPIGTADQTDGSRRPAPSASSPSTSSPVDAAVPADRIPAAPPQ